ncbi:MAG: sulfur oxidation c-type cytochrome SoxA [Rhodospirillales bacterium]
MAAIRPIARIAAALFAVVASHAAAGEIAPADRRSGADFMGPALRAMQDDDFANPGMLAVQDGAALWREKAGAAGRACADCHGDAAASMKGIAARYPAFDEASNAPIDLAGRINQCRAVRQEAPAFDHEAAPLLALSAYLGSLSRGVPAAAGDDARLAPFVAAGKRLYEARQGQLNLSCAACHDDNWGKRLAGSVIPQAHPTGYPIYRLEWQAMGSLQRRLRNCLVGVRAEPYAYGAPEYVQLELYLMTRARGMPMETPGVRP